MSLDKYARRLLRVERDLKNLAITPRLPHSSVDGGTIVFNTPDGQTPMVTIGDQPDGTTGVNHTNGPPPPTPTQPLVAGESPATITVEWDGLFASPGVNPVTGDTLPGPVVPLDFSRVEIHSSPNDDFIPDLETTLKATVESPRGGRVVLAVPYEETVYVKLVARSQSGRGSQASEQASGMARRIDNEDIEPFSLQADSLGDFILAVTKFKTLQHQIY